MARFSVRDILVSFTLIALGGGGLRLLYDLRPWSGASGFLAVLTAWCVCGAVIGAGIAYPFNMWRYGCAIGLLLHFMILIVAGILSTFH